ncbi:MAG: hypothetical protein U5L96_13920 [Owenweeksia sp.]|nr:hypothetical protein [Owenweeksia sp.]
MLATAVKVFRWLTIRNYDLANKESPLANKRLTQFMVLERIVIAIIIVVGMGAVLMTFETVRSYGTSLLASAGIAGIIIRGGRPAQHCHFLGRGSNCNHAAHTPGRCCDGGGGVWCDRRN